MLYEDDHLLTYNRKCILVPYTEHVGPFVRDPCDCFSFLPVFLVCFACLAGGPAILVLNRNTGSQS